MRRRALCAASAASGGGGGEQSWAYELHLTPEWESDPFGGPMAPDYADVYGDFSEVYQFLMDMCVTLGNYGSYGGSNWYVLDNIPNECNITVDGERLTYLALHGNAPYLDVTFGDIYCSGTLSSTQLNLDRE